MKWATTIRLTKIILLLALLLSSNAVYARNDEVISPSEAMSIAQEQYGGKVIGKELVRGDGPPYYRVKIISNGRIRVVKINALRGH